VLVPPSGANPPKIVTAGAVEELDTGEACAVFAQASTMALEATIGGSEETTLRQPWAIRARPQRTAATTGATVSASVAAESNEVFGLRYNGTSVEVTARNVTFYNDGAAIDTGSHDLGAVFNDTKDRVLSVDGEAVAAG